MKIKYPYQPMMQDFDRRPLRRGLMQNKSHRRKYHNRKLTVDGHKFDSKVEVQFYELLKAEKIKFKCHPRITTIPHTEWHDHGRSLVVNKHSYTPDFATYDDAGNMMKMFDIKGIMRVPAYDHLRMDMAVLKTGVPVVIVRKKHGRFIFKTRNVR